MPFSILPTLGNCYASAAGKLAHRLHEREGLHLHHELEYIAPLSTSKAFEDAADGLTLNDGVFSS